MFNLEEIESKKYISLETFKKNNQPIRTPVWFVIKNNLVYVITREKTGKIKRLKNNQQVKIATCTIKGKITGQWFSGNAKFLSKEENRNAIEMRDEKYEFMAKIAKFLSKGKGELVAFSIKPD